ncbi:zf-TFIIB domain-containing protein [Cryobacterium sp. PAMC25264]|nr:zf-TFIIB domain-containing protein [Cryobacterium sp. PAMC25264]
MDDLQEISTPNCPNCLTLLEPVSRGRSTWWQCAQCGLRRL